MATWRVSDLTAVDGKGRVVKDEHGALVLDPRNPRIRGYRQRWYVDGYGQQRSRSFKRNERGEAERFHQRLADAAERSAEADPAGLPIVGDAPTVSPPQRGVAPTFEDAAEEYWAKKSSKWTATNTITFHRSQLAFAAAVLRVVDGTPLDYRADGAGSSMPLHAVTPALCEELILVRRHTDLRRRAQLQRLRLQGLHVTGEPELVSARTEIAFATTMGMFFNWAPKAMSAMALTHRARHRPTTTHPRDHPEVRTGTPRRQRPLRRRRG